MMRTVDAIEQPLTGGSINTVVRVGDTVRRLTGPQTSGVHALLRHLESAGFDYAPRVFGVDEQGREVLSYIEGTPASRPWPPILRGETGLVAIGRMLAELAEAVSTFQPPADAEWLAGGIAPGGSFRHGDLGPWNIIWRDNELVGLIDWDFAEPAPPLWDLAGAAWSCVPLRTIVAGLTSQELGFWRNYGFDAAPDLSRRLAALCEGYGAEPGDVLDVLIDLQALEVRRTTELGGQGIHPYSMFLERGEFPTITADAAWLSDHRATLLSSAGPERRWTSPGDPAPRPSARARIVLIDDTDRVLLFSVRDERDGSTRWFSPGGGLEPGESHEQAALRELREETGLTDVNLGPEVWRGKPWTATWDGVAQEVRQRYFLARVPACEIDTSGFDDLERSAITGHHWWSVEELAATRDILRPAGLPELLATLLRDGPPELPITVAG